MFPTNLVPILIPYDLLHAFLAIRQEVHAMAIPMAAEAKMADSTHTIPFHTQLAPYHNTVTIDRLLDTTNCLFCHKQNDTTTRKAWGNATQITGGTHNWYMGDNISKCWSCHVSTGTAPKDFHSDTMRAGGGTDCIACHSPNDVNISLFGRHANINTCDGLGNVTNNDCWTCHYQKDMDRSHVYLCDNCHTNTSGVVQVTDPALILGDFYHGPTTCKNCHAPVIYHMKGKAGPKGTIDSVLPD